MSTLDSYRAFTAHVMVALWHKGIDSVEITREQLEDDAHMLVTVHHDYNFAKDEMKIRWTLKGFPERAKPPLGPPPRIVISNHAQEMLDWLAQLNDVDAVTICKNPRDGGWACLVTFIDKRPWYKRWFTARPRLVDGWGETPTDSMLAAATIVEYPK